MSTTLQALHKLIVVTGHFGAGKTNFAVNLAIRLAREGKPVTLVDLDIVNPYFRAADNKKQLEELGVVCIVPDYANTNVDIPSLPPTVMGALETAHREPDRYTILDVGGDNGAVALGMYNRYFTEGQYELLYTASMYRPLTEQAEDALANLKEIEQISRLRATGIVHNSNLGAETTSADILAAVPWADALAAESGLPLVCTCVMKDIAGELSLPDLFVMENVTKQIY